MSEVEFAKRLEKLERDNRRLKTFAFAALVLPIALVSIYATRPVPDIIMAHTFEAVDSSGRVRAEMTGDLAGTPALMLRNKEHLVQVEISDFYSSPSIVLGLHPVSMSQDSAVLPDVLISDSPSGQPTIELHHRQGFTTALGSTSTITPATGATQQTSAASIVMFGNDKKHLVIWQAP